VTKKLLLVSPYFAPEGGGLEAYAREIAVRLEGSGRWQVVVATSGPAHRGLVERDGALEVHRLGSDITISSTRLGVCWPARLRRLIRDERPDIVNAHAPVPGLADLVRFADVGAPIVVTYHSGSMHKGSWAKDVLIDAYERSAGRRLVATADWLIATSDFVRDGYLARVRAKATTIGPGVDVDLFRPAEPGRRRDASAPRLVVTGSLGVEDLKGIGSAIEVTARLQEIGVAASLDVIGDGPGLPRLRALARQRGVEEHVTFLGVRPPFEVASTLRGADVFVLPTRNDNVPLAVLEAMATALPVVTTTVGALSSVVSDGESGHLVAPRDVDALFDRVVSLVADPARARAMGRRGRQLVLARSSWDRQAAATGALLEAVSEGRPPDGRRRIAVVAPHLPPKVGGLEHYADRVASGLQASGRFEVITVTSNHEARRESVEVRNDLTTIRLPSWLRVSNTPLSPWWPAQIRSVLRANRVDLVNVHTPVPGIAEAAAIAARERPVVVTYHAGSMVKGQPHVDRVIRCYERYMLPRLLGRVERVVAVSPFVRDAFLSQWLDDRDVDLIPPGVDVERYVPAPMVDPPTHTITYVGRIERTSRWKGIEVLVEALALLADDDLDARLELVGGGDAVADHRRLVASLGLSDRVTFTGPLAGDELVAAYQRASVVVLPSTSEAESFGMALIESMATGTPVIGSRIGGIPDVIADGVDGLLVPPGDAPALARACAEVLRDPDLARRLGNHGRLKVLRQYSWDDRVARYDRLFSACFSGACLPTPTIDLSGVGGGVGGERLLDGVPGRLGRAVVAAQAEPVLHSGRVGARVAVGVEVDG
jgi:glycosyltransferase involved in cell wall biosynthesis